MSTHGTTTRSRLRPRLAAVVAGALTAGGLVALAPAAHADSAVSGGSLNWGFKQSFRSYVSGNMNTEPIADRIKVTAPATFDPAGPAVPTTPAEAARPYIFAAQSGVVKSATDVKVSTTGGVTYRFPSHGFEVVLSNLEVEVAGTTATIYADTMLEATEVFGDVAPGHYEDDHVAVATGTAAVTVNDEDATVVGTEVTLTAAGAAALPMYAAGSALDDFTLTTAQEDPSVSVSQTTVSENGSTLVTVTGHNFAPALASGTRPPLSGKPAGTYVVFGKFNPNWKPSGGAAGSARTAATVVQGGQKWAVPADSVATVGGAGAGAITLSSDGSFTTQLRISKSLIDAAAAGTPANTQYGIYTYPGSGADQALYETYTPISFSADGTNVALDAGSYGAVEGNAIPVDVTVTDSAVAGTPTGEVTLASVGGDGVETVLDTAALNGSGTAGLEVPANRPAGSGSLIVHYEGDGSFAAADSSPAAYTIKVDSVLSFDKTTYPATAGETTPVKLTVTRPSGIAAPTGNVTLTYTPTGGSAVSLAPVNLNAGANGVATFNLPALAAGASGTLSATYAGNTAYDAATATGGSYTVAKRATSVTIGGPDNVAYGASATYTATVTDGTVGGQVVVTGAGAPATLTIGADRSVSYSLPTGLAPGAVTLTFSYAGDADTEPSSAQKAIAVGKSATTPTTKVAKKVSAKKAGKVRITLASTDGTAPTGKVVVTLKKGKKTKKVKGTLKNGVVVVKVPKLAKGKWKATVVYAGDATHAPSTTTFKLKVKKK